MPSRGPSLWASCPRIRSVSAETLIVKAMSIGVFVRRFSAGGRSIRPPSAIIACFTISVIAIFVL